MGQDRAWRTVPYRTVPHRTGAVAIRGKEIPGDEKKAVIVVQDDLGKAKEGSLCVTKETKRAMLGTKSKCNRIEERVMCWVTNNKHWETKRVL